MCQPCYIALIGFGTGSGDKDSATIAGISKGSGCTVAGNNVDIYINKMEWGIGPTSVTGAAAQQIIERRICKYACGFWNIAKPDGEFIQGKDVAKEDINEECLKALWGQ